MEDNQYVILYDTLFTANCQQVSIIAKQPPTDAEVRDALLKVSVNIKHVKNIRVIEIHPGDRINLPRWKMWPFTSRLFDRNFAQEQEEAEPSYWTGEYEVMPDGLIASRITYCDPKISQEFDNGVTTRERLENPMNILDTCVGVIREYTIQQAKNEVLGAIDYLKSTRKDLTHAISDREWLFDFVVYRPDLRWKAPEVVLSLPTALRERNITKKDIWQWIDEALGNSVPLLELPPLPHTTNLDPWCAVLIEEKLYCCSCRSLHEGTPLTEGMMSSYYRDAYADFCAECDGDL